MKTLIVIIVFVVLLSVAAVIIIGSRTFEGIVTDRPYEKGLSWDKSQIEKAESGLSVDILTKFFTTGHNEILFSVIDSEGKSPLDARVYAVISRPSSSAYDMTFDALGPKDGVYAASVDFPLYGYWDLKICVTRGGKSLTFDNKIFAQKGGSPQ